MNLISRYLAICLFRSGPEQIPASISVLQITFIAYLLIGVFINVLDNTLSIALLISLADIAILAVFLYLLLSGYKKTNRFQQTLSAVMGSSAILSVIVLPLMAMFYQYDDATQVASWLVFALMVMVLWSLMVMAHVIRRAINSSAPVSVAWTFAYVAISVISNGLVLSAVS